MVDVAGPIAVGVVDAAQLRPALLAMLAALVLVLGLAGRRGRLARREGWALVGLYPAFVALVLLT